MLTSHKTHDGIVVCRGKDGALQAWAYQRKEASAPAPKMMGFGGHVDDEPALPRGIPSREFPEN